MPRLAGSCARRNAAILRLRDFAASYPFELEKEDYLVHITTGTHVAQICLFLLTESRHFPARLLQTSPPRQRSGEPQAGTFSIIDLDPILLTGPTGAGKSQLARRIFELKKDRRQISGQFAEVNCATLRGDAVTYPWPGNFRDFDAAITRMATLSDGGRISAQAVQEEIEQLTHPASAPAPHASPLIERVLGAERAARLDRFDRVQLQDVLSVCQSSRTLSEAGRALFRQLSCRAHHS